MIYINDYKSCCLITFDCLWEIKPTQDHSKRIRYEKYNPINLLKYKLRKANTLSFIKFARYFVYGYKQHKKQTKTKTIATYLKHVFLGF